MVTVVCDASPLMALGKLNQLYLLPRLFDHFQPDSRRFSRITT